MGSAGLAGAPKVGVDGNDRFPEGAGPSGAGKFPGGKDMRRELAEQWPQRGVFMVGRDVGGQDVLRGGLLLVAIGEMSADNSGDEPGNWRVSPSRRASA